jgi:hypothetical protein
MDILVRLILGIGTLFIYDATPRIGAKLNFEPKKVHIHSGTKKGAHALGVFSLNDIVNKSCFPDGICDLEPLQIEDLLCIFKDKFGKGVIENKNLNSCK